MCNKQYILSCPANYNHIITLLNMSYNKPIKALYVFEKIPVDKLCYHIATCQNYYRQFNVNLFSADQNILYPAIDLTKTYNWYNMMESKGFKVINTENKKNGWLSLFTHISAMIKRCLICYLIHDI